MIFSFVSIYDIIILGDWMIDTIEINISNGILPQLSAYVVYQDKVCYINNKKYLVDDLFLKQLKDILYTFKNEYGTSQQIDAEEFIIKVSSSGREDIYHGKGVFPVNYHEFKKLLGDVYAR